MGSILSMLRKVNNIILLTEVAKDLSYAGYQINEVEDHQHMKDLSVILEKN